MDEACRGSTVEEVVQSVETAAGNPIPIFSVGFGNDIDEEGLQQVARFTGGQTMVAPNSASLTELVRMISNQIKGQFELSYPTGAESGFVRLELVENNSQQSDSRQAFIPEAAEPTPTPVPQFSIGLNASPQSDEGRIEITVEVPADVVLEKTELFVNDNLVQRLVSEPFDTFEVDINQLGSGTHRIRVEATDELGRVASNEVEATVNIPPTPVPTTPPTPEPLPATPVAEPESGLSAIGATSTLAIVMIGAGLLLLLALIGLIAYLLFFYGKRPAAATDSSPASPAAPAPPPPASPVMDIDALDATEIDLEPVRVTEPVGVISGGRAKLVVLTGQHALSQPEFSLDKPEIRLGRNTSKETLNDIAVQDREASRSHAKIVFWDKKYYVKDLKSSTGTKVNGKKITPFEDVLLADGTEISIGPRVTFRFEIEPPAPPDATLIDVEDELRTIDDDRTVW
jgi:hypothetical protein